MADREKITIVTHSGNFHADEIFAVATLFLVLEKDYDISVIRSREDDIIKNADYVVDVGGIYNPDKNRFDHHQIGGAGQRQNTIPYASFGLVWKKYGEELCGSLEIAEKIDQKLIQYIDATDNGMEPITTKIEDVYPYDIGLFFNSFTPDWREGNDRIDDIFMEVVSLAKTVLSREILKRKNLSEVKIIIEKIYKESGDKRLIIFDESYPAREFLVQYPEPLFAVFPRDDSKWSLVAIRNDEYSFVNRKDLPLSWAGKRDEELEKITGVSGSVFCHNGRFMAVAKTKEAILKLAELALKD